MHYKPQERKQILATCTCESKAIYTSETNVLQTSLLENLQKWKYCTQFIKLEAEIVTELVNGTLSVHGRH